MGLTEFIIEGIKCALLFYIIEILLDIKEIGRNILNLKRKENECVEDCKNR